MHTRVRSRNAELVLVVHGGEEGFIRHRGIFCPLQEVLSYW